MSIQMLITVSAVTFQTGNNSNVHQQMKRYTIGNELLICITTWMNFKIIMLGKKANNQGYTMYGSIYIKFQKI